MKNKPRMYLLMFSLILLIAAAGCGGLGTEEPTITPEPTRADNVQGEWTQEEAVEAVRTDLAERLDISQEEISVVSAESREWEDASLGCPEEGEMYAQVITQGFQVLLEADGSQFDYRTDTLGSVKLCEQ